MPLGKPPQRDNLLGVCHAIGATFGFNPLWLRMLFVIGLLADFETTLIAYGAGALAVALAGFVTGDTITGPRSA